MGGGGELEIIFASNSKICNLFLNTDILSLGQPEGRRGKMMVLIWPQT